MTRPGLPYPSRRGPGGQQYPHRPVLPPVAELEQAAQVLCTCLRLAALEKLGV